MAREHRILAALGPTAVPVPPVLGLCDDDSVIGAPFYVMAFVEGAIFDGTEAVAGVPVDVRRRSSEHLIDVLADLHDLDIDRVGLGDLARRSGYIERQLQRWTQQWERCATRELPLIDEVARRLGDSIPAQQRASITHGDFRFGNCLVDVEAGRIAALLDWELCTLGDPLADVGYLGVQWYDGNPRHARRSDPTPAGGFASFDEILARYAARTGRDVGCIDYYVAFSCWRLAVISEGVYGRYRQGAMGDATDVDLDYFRDSVEVLAGRALGML
jgi:aminoglycoside phosphotransferase (APT) family kinase protein